MKDQVKTNEYLFKNSPKLEIIDGTLLIDGKSLANVIFSGDACKIECSANSRLVKLTITIGVSL